MKKRLTKSQYLLLSGWDYHASGDRWTNRLVRGCRFYDAKQPGGTIGCNDGTAPRGYTEDEAEEIQKRLDNARTSHANGWANTDVEFSDVNELIDKECFAQEFHPFADAARWAAEQGKEYTGPVE